jgi:hypothetical protein
MAGLIPLSSHAVTAPVISDSYISPSVASPISPAPATVSVYPTATALLKFDLSALPAVTSANISKASLVFYITKVNGTAGKLKIGAIDTPVTWDENAVTINNTQVVTKSTPAPIVTPAAVGPAGNYYSIDITPFVQAWIDDPGSNHGLAITPQTSASLTFESRESTGTSHPAYIEIALKGVNTITVTSPLNKTGTVDEPNLSISQANGSTNGYLGSADWLAFSSKVGSVGVNSPLTLSGTPLAPVVGLDIVPVANGGTGANSLAGYLFGNGASAVTAKGKIPSTDISGSMADGQVDDNLTIDGGAVKNTPIGSGGAAAGAFTSLQVTGGAAANKVLTSDVSGNATWQARAPVMFLARTGLTAATPSGHFPVYGSSAVPTLPALIANVQLLVPDTCTVSNLIAKTTSSITGNVSLWVNGSSSNYTCAFNNATTCTVSGTAPTLQAGNLINWNVSSNISGFSTATVFVSASCQ